MKGGKDRGMGRQMNRGTDDRRKEGDMEKGGGEWRDR